MAVCAVCIKDDAISTWDDLIYKQGQESGGAHKKLLEITLLTRNTQLSFQYGPRIP